jgi:ceramide glucosyltransferase
MLSAILGGLAVLSAGLNVWQWAAAGRFALHRRTGKRDSTPGLTLLKPLKGGDEATRACLESWFTQDYPGPLQILFGVSDAGDPVCEIVRTLQKNYPHRDSELIFCDPILGANAKVSTLTYLEKKAKHPFWIISDADVFVPQDLLSEIAQPFTRNDVALVNCFYKLSRAKNDAMVWENIGVNADFWSQVCQSNSIKPMNFALGAVMAVRREPFEKLGGFKTLLNQLADDYQLGRRLAEAGHQIELSNIVVECRESARSYCEVWKHQLRWARTIRFCQPGPYFASILSNATLWLILWAAAGGWKSVLLFDLCCLIRPLTAMHNAWRLTRNPAQTFEAMFAPLKDVLQFAAWLCAFSGNTVTWRGETFHVKRGGELMRIQG